MKTYSTTKKTIAAALLAVGVSTTLTACDQPAVVASKNLSTAADNFEILRRVVFIDTWTGKNMLEVDGYCSLGNDRTATEISVTCKVGSNYKKVFLGVTNNVTYVIDQVDPAQVSSSQYRVVWQPSALIPNVEVK